ncbi:MAG: hypothetical protein Fur0016_25970 [Anaerolineales bacterium]
MRGERNKGVDNGGNGEAEWRAEEAEKRSGQRRKRRSGVDNGGSGEAEWTADETESGVDNG